MQFCEVCGAEWTHTSFELWDDGIQVCSDCFKRPDDWSMEDWKEYRLLELEDSRV